MLQNHENIPKEKCEITKLKFQKFLLNLWQKFNVYIFCYIYISFEFIVVVLVQIIKIHVNMHQGAGFRRQHKMSTGGPRWNFGRKKSKTKFNLKKKELCRCVIKYAISIWHDEECCDSFMLTLPMFRLPFC